MDTYYAGIAGNLLMFVIGYLIASFMVCKPRDLTNLTVWTRDNTPYE
jgi:hypothetical protein